MRARDRASRGRASPRRVARVALAAAVSLAAAACARHEPPAPDASPSIALPELAAPAVSASPSPPSASASSGSPAPSAPASAAASDPATDPSLLPQTRDRPAPSGAAIDARTAALWAAVVSDDPEKAMPFFFPVGAYRQVKDIPDPASDWKRRLVAAYAHDIHALHASLRDAGPRATLVGLQLPDTRARWVDPGEEYNKIGYYRVFGSRVRYTVDGEDRAFDVKSLISWRGEWYVVHLSAIK